MIYAGAKARRRMALHAEFASCAAYWSGNAWGGTLFFDKVLVNGAPAQCRVCLVAHVVSVYVPLWDAGADFNQELSWQHPATESRAALLEWAGVHAQRQLNGKKRRR